MSRPLRAALLAACAATAVVGGGSAWGAVDLNLDPFSHGAGGGGEVRGPARPSLLRLSQAEPAPAEPAQPTASGTTTAGAPSSTSPGSTDASRAVPSPGRVAAGAPPPRVCAADTDCPDESFCQQGFCRRIEQRVNIFYLYYREGSFRELLGLYWAKRGSTGYTVVAPVYWHYWSPTSRSRVVAPFYWRFEDDAAHSTSTVIVPGLPISWSRQPGAHSFGIWPLFYLSNKFGWAAPLLGSFKIADPDRGKSFGALAFLYWWQRGPAGAFDLGFPLFVSSRSAASAFTFALPLNFYWRSGTDAHTLAIPFFYRETGKDSSATYSLLGYYERTGPETDGTVAWLYWFGRDRAHDRAHDVVFPLLWSFRARSSGVSVFFPLVWDFHDRDSRTTVVGPVVHVREGRGWFNSVVPLWWTAGNVQTGWRFQMLLPLFFWKTGGHGQTLTWVSPIGGYSRDGKAASRTWLLLPALFFRRDPVHEIDVVTPLYIRHRNIEADATTRLITLLYLRDDPGGSTQVLFPLFWRFKDRPTGASATAVLPLFFHRQGPRDTTTFAGPIYWRRFNSGGWGAGVFPLAFFGRHDGNTHAVVFPLFWRFASARAETTLLLPIYFTSRDRDGRDSGILPLLTFFGDHHGASYQVQFPLFWRFADVRQRRAMTVTPLGFFGSSPEGWRAGVLPPLLWARGGGPQRHLVLFPLFWHFADDRQDQSTTVAALYMHRRRGGEITDAFFPLIYYRRGARPGGSEEVSFTLFPLVHYRRDANLHLLVTPLGASVVGPRRAGGFVGLYAWYRGARISAAGIPLLYADVSRLDERGNTTERTRQWGPLFAIDAPDHDARVLLPLFGRFHDAHETDTYVFPSFFRQRKTDGYAVDAFLPLFWHSRWRDRTTTVVGPWYSRAGDQVHDTGFVPLYFWAKNPARTVLFIPPLLTFHRHDFRTNTINTWAALYYRGQSPDGERILLFPLWWSGSQGTRSYRVLGPLYWHFEDGKAGTSWSLLTLLYWSQDHSKRTRALLPIAWYTRDDKVQAASEALMPLFYAAHGPNHFTFLTLLAGVSRSPETRRWYVGPLYVSNTVTSSTRVFFPLYFSHLDRATETRTRLFLPLAHFSRANPETSLSTWAVLFWRRTDVTSATTLVLPLFFDVHDYRSSRTTVLLPLLLRHANEITGDSFAVAPLFYRSVTPTTSTTVAFPLYWDFKKDDRRTTVFFPLFARWTRPTYTGTYVFPIFYYRTGYAAGSRPRMPDGTWRLFIPPLFDAAVQRPGDLRWEILGGLFGKERIGRNHYLKILFLTFETQRASAAQTSWYGQPQRTPRVRPPRGLATNIW